MSEHTAGEWRVGNLDHNEQRTIIGPDGQLIAVCAHECVASRIPEMEANAARIVQMNIAYDELLMLVRRVVRIGELTPRTAEIVLAAAENSIGCDDRQEQGEGE